MVGRNKLIVVVVISCGGGEAGGSISLKAGAVTNNIYHVLHNTKSVNNTKLSLYTINT